MSTHLREIDGCLLGNGFLCTLWLIFILIAINPPTTAPTHAIPKCFVVLLKTISP